MDASTDSLWFGSVDFVLPQDYCNTYIVCIQDDKWKVKVQVAIPEPEHVMSSWWWEGENTPKTNTTFPENSQNSTTKQRK